ncbi:30S ribosomal protein S14 [Marinicaulis aureus]|uniref:Small ribosomal subunit protein uS14 n=1 Tax=Hyphococcus aureus TaxID=2666033 RepID=A0ABW1L1S2_9PROT
MAKKSMVERDLKRRRMAKKFESKRNRLKAIIRDQDQSGEDRFMAALRLAELPRNSSKTRIRNRCLVSGRPRGYYRKLKMSRIALRQLGSAGLIPGLVKSSW